MRRLFILGPVLCLFLPACSSGTGSDGSGGIRELTANRPAVGAINTVGQVDWYRYRVTEPNTLLQITCTAGPRSAAADVLVSVYRVDANGNRVPLHGEYAPTGPVTYVNIEIGPHLDLPTDLHIRVRSQISDHSYSLTVRTLDPADRDRAFATAAGSVPADEIGADDTRETAATMTTDAAGAIGYAEDQDWHLVPTTAAVVQHVKLLDLTFAGETAAEGSFLYEIEIIDEEGAVVLSHRHRVDDTRLPYHTQVRAGIGNHYLTVRAAPGQVPTGWERYQVTVEVLDVDDPDEAGAGNDTPETASPLAPSATKWHTGRILHQGDVDVYAVDAERSRAQILEVYLETDEASAADYTISILRQGVETQVLDAYGGDGPTRLKTSLFVPAADSPPAPVRYFVRVADLQGDEGDALVPYRIRVDLVDVPADLPTPYREDGAVYRDEAADHVDGSRGPVPDRASPGPAHPG